MHDTGDPALDRLRALADGFRQHACGELRDMQQRLARPAENAAARADLPPLLHRLAGSGSTFGFDALGQRARALQRALVDAERDGAPLALDRVLTQLALAEQELANSALPSTDEVIQALDAAREVRPPRRRDG